MNYEKLRLHIKELSYNSSFDEAQTELSEEVLTLTNLQCASIILDIGAIPEDIAIDSTEEKLYTKVSEILLSRVFQGLGMKSVIINTRGDSADVTAKSRFHNYSLVADSKTFRLSRTAKNQKDFKVSSLAKWRGDDNYAVLVCPYYQYPRSLSQIFTQALENNVCLLSWEYMSYLLQNSIEETSDFSLAPIWNISDEIASNTSIANSRQCFLPTQYDTLKAIFNQFRLNDFNDFLLSIKDHLKKRGKLEIQYWNCQVDMIKKYSKQQAIDALLYNLGLRQKIETITKFISSLQ